MENVQTISTWLINYISEKCDIPVALMDTTTRFSEYGVDSIEAVNITNLLFEKFGLELDPSALFEFNTIELLMESIQQPA
jgi:acyl carrier protein